MDTDTLVSTARRMGRRPTPEPPWPAGDEPLASRSSVQPAGTVSSKPPNGRLEHPSRRGDRGNRTAGEQAAG